MKKAFFVFVCVFLLSACTSPAMSPESSNDSPLQDKAPQQTEDHLGCQEGEVINGECVLPESEEQNASIFENLDSLTVRSETVEYADGISGYLARPNEDGVYPGVVMIHEWWGLNDNIKTMADLLANEGYVVLAVDIYKGEVAQDSDAARVLATAAREDTAGSVQNMKSAVQYLKDQSFVAQNSIGSLGWCFGGQQSLNLALESDDLSATVIYYGNLVTNPEQLQSIQWPVLGIFGEEDTSIPVETVQEFENALDEVGVQNDIYIYPRVGHAFANPSGSRYAPEETQDAWNKTLDFLADTLKSVSDE
jgi:carboxymethylenebutenolidase